MPPKKSKDLSVLDVTAPTLSQKLARTRQIAEKLTSRWGLPSAVEIPDLQNASFKRRIYPTGLLSLDKLLRIGGLPRGHITEFFGKPGAGKSLLQYKVISSVQHFCHNCASPWAVSYSGPEKDRHGTCSKCHVDDSGGLFCLYDQENVVDPVWLASQGIENSALLVLRLPNGEQAGDLVRATMQEHNVDGFSIDSISQLQPKAEQERSMVDDATMMGLHAKVMAQICRHIVASFLANPEAAPLFMWINQIRADVSGHGGLKVTGGYMPEHSSSIRLYLNKQAMVNQNKPEEGNKGRLTAKKCRAAKDVENRTLDYIINPNGFDVALDAYLTAVASDVFSISGGSHYFNGSEVKLGTSKDNVIQKIREDSGFLAEVRGRVFAAETIEQVPEIYSGDDIGEEESNLNDLEE